MSIFKDLVFRFSQTILKYVCELSWIFYTSFFIILVGIHAFTVLWGNLLLKIMQRVTFTTVIFKACTSLPCTTFMPGPFKPVSVDWSWTLHDWLITEGYTCKTFYLDNKMWNYCWLIFSKSVEYALIMWFYIKKIIGI